MWAVGLLINWTLRNYRPSFAGMLSNVGSTKKSCIRETVILSTCKNSGTNKKIINLRFYFFKNYLSCVLCHKRQQPQPQTRPLLTPTLCTVGWFARTSLITQKQTKNIINPKHHTNLKSFLVFQFKRYTH